MHSGPGAGRDALTRVHVIYVGDTVARLLPFLATLLDQTSWPLRVVMNGCDRAGRRALEEAHAEYPERIELLEISEDRVLGHGEVLDRLLALETSPYFCVVDSDVFAISPTDLSAIMPRPDEAASSSCLPMWQPVEAAVMPSYLSRIWGPYVRTERGDSLGCTSASAYRVAELHEVVDRYGVGFRQAEWQQLPDGVRDELQQRGLRRDFYDTGKVVNLLLASRSRPVAYRDVSSLVHVGSWTSRHRSVNGTKQRLGRIARHRAPRVFRLWSLTWLITKGFGVRESRAIADWRMRQDQANRLIDAIEDGTATFDGAPGWFTDRRLFDDMTRLLGPASSSATGDDSTEAFLM